MHADENSIHSSFRQKELNTNFWSTNFDDACDRVFHDNLKVSSFFLSDNNRLIRLLIRWVREEKEQSMIVVQARQAILFIIIGCRCRRESYGRRVRKVLLKLTLIES